MSNFLLTYRSIEKHFCVYRFRFTKHAFVAPLFRNNICCFFFFEYNRCVLFYLCKKLTICIILVLFYLIRCHLHSILHTNGINTTL